MENKEWSDPSLGRVIVHTDKRAKRILYRVRPDGVYVTVPPMVSELEVKCSFERLRDKLLHARKHIPLQQAMGWNYSIDVPGFRLRLKESEIGKVRVEYHEGEMQILCPANTDFSNVELQIWLKKVVERGLKLAATSRLKRRLKELADYSDLKFNSVRVNVSKSRWGSCSSEKNINLSCYILLLPAHLADYVLLHELAHTVEMNHSQRFWNLLDKLTGNRSKQLRQELRQYRTGL